MAKKKLSNTKGCGQRRTTKSSAPTDGKFRSGKQHPNWHGSFDPGLVGTRYGYLEIISSTLKRVKGYIYVKVRCHSSGKTAWRALDSMRSGAATSLHRNGRIPVPHAKILGRRFDAARARCTKPSHKQFADYGGRGIQMRFASRMEFIRWVVEHLPHEDYVGVEIDRRNNNGHYEPGNLRLVTRKEQLANRRNTGWVFWRGGKVLVDEWPSPYERGTTARYARLGLTGEQIIAQAHKAVSEKRKNWQTIAARLASMTL